MAVSTLVFLGGLFFITIFGSSASPVPMDNCRYNLIGNMEGTRGCEVVHHDAYIAIYCDGKLSSSVRKILAKYTQYGCRQPIYLRLEHPRFPITPALFHGVQSRLYRLELWSLQSDIKLAQAFRGLPALETLTLQFNKTPRNQTLVLRQDLFGGLEALQLLRLYTEAVPVRLASGAFEPLRGLRCLYFSGENVECGCGFDEFTRWKAGREGRMLGEMPDRYIPGTVNQCSSTLQCRIKGKSSAQRNDECP
ncbi:hypothetical protein BV898_01811 [Hypsibius exemplaris]|uniref:Uncharacterized protein n=1 Tax=Hypsibius exemplaris TaxID=2072580 RepID=A0A1W0XA37_HYPEX|nr:hypothetical protein BV898_01811 [Hypsibius exemplaris]